MDKGIFSRAFRVLDPNLAKAFWYRPRIRQHG
jgi:hypothetical protein